MKKAKFKTGDKVTTPNGKEGIVLLAWWYEDIPSRPAFMGYEVFVRPNIVKGIAVNYIEHFREKELEVTK